MGRNYKNGPQNAKKRKGTDMQKCPVKGCNRKYKRADRLQDHVEKEHYYDTCSVQQERVTKEIEIQIYEACKRYLEVLKQYEFYPDGTVSTDAAARRLMPQGGGPEEFERMRVAQRTFATRMLWEQDFFILNIDWQRAMKHFIAFLELGLPYYDTNFNPTLPIDFLWHAAMQEPSLEPYIKGIPHCAKDRTRAEDLERHAYFRAVFERKYHRQPYDGENQRIHPTVDGAMFDAQIERIRAELRLEEQKQEAERIKWRAQQEQFAREYQEREAYYKLNPWARPRERASSC